MNKFKFIADEYINEIKIKLLKDKNDKLEKQLKNKDYINTMRELLTNGIITKEQYDKDTVASTK